MTTPHRPRRQRREPERQRDRRARRVLLHARTRRRDPLPDNNGLDDKSIEVDVFNQSDACIDRMNNDARRVGQLAQKSDIKCVKKGTGNVTACVDDPAEPKTDKQGAEADRRVRQRVRAGAGVGRQRRDLLRGRRERRRAVPHAGGLPGGSCVGGACISAAAETGAGAITHDLFGATVNVASDRDTANCQAQVIQRAGKLYAARWKAFRKCKKDNFMPSPATPS